MHQTTHPNPPKRLTLLCLVAVSAAFQQRATAQPVWTADDLRYHDSLARSVTLDPTVPTPDSVLGFPLGRTALRYDAIVRYLHVLADASPAVTITPYAQTHEGRALYYLTITDPRNHARLDEIREIHAKIADPRRINPGEDVESLLRNHPAVAWLAYSIHGDELSGADAAVQVAFLLAAGTDEFHQSLRRELVVHIDPMMNPDGRERYLSQLQQLAGKVINTDHQSMQHSGLWSAGRGNHYLFDLNRDWLCMTQPETLGRAAAIQSWNPQLVIDAHEMGTLETYLFDPPRQPINAFLSPTVLNWRRRFSAAQAKAFDRHGWSYYTQEWYEEWYPGYTNSWAALLGAVGLLYEQAGVDGAAVTQEAGNLLSYAQAVDQQATSSFANLESLRANRVAILRDYLADRRKAVAPDDATVETLVVPPPADAARFARFKRFLDQQAFEYTVADQPFRASGADSVWGEHLDTVELPAGTVIVRANQPHRRLLLAMLRFDPHPSDRFLQEERESIEKGRGTRAYDVMAYNVCMAYGLDAYWAERVPVVRARADEARDAAHSHRSPADLNAAAGYGFLIDGASRDVPAVLGQLLRRGFKPRIATKPFKIEDRPFNPGSVLLRKSENPDSLVGALTRLAGRFRIDVVPTDTALSQDGPDLGGKRFGLLHRPRVAIASQWPVSTSGFGAVWHLLDAETRLDVSPINIQNLAFIDLRKYNVLVLPDTFSRSGLSAILDESTLESVKSWVEAGGTLIAVGSSAAFLADEARGLSAVRLKRDVLDKLDVYAQDLKRFRDARNVTIDPELIWQVAPSGEPGQDKPENPDNKTGDKEAGEGQDVGLGNADPSARKTGDKEDLETKKRNDRWNRRFSPQGAFAAADLDVEHWLCSGLDARLPVLVQGSFAFMAKSPVAAPVRLAPADEIRLSGLMWPEARNRLADTAWATVERVGHGQVILFATNPVYRGYFQATSRLLLNAVILGPGLGTDQPIPW